MDQDRNNPNPAANTSEADDDRWSSEADTVERVDREAVRQSPGHDADGITNRHEEIIPRTREERGTTPRRYEQADDKALPSDDPTYRTEI